MSPACGRRRRLRTTASAESTRPAHRRRPPSASFARTSPAPGGTRSWSTARHRSPEPPASTQCRSETSRPCSRAGNRSAADRAAPLVAPARRAASLPAATAASSGARRRELNLGHHRRLRQFDLEPHARRLRRLAAPRRHRQRTRGRLGIVARRELPRVVADRAASAATLRAQSPSTASRREDVAARTRATSAAVTNPPEFPKLVRTYDVTAATQSSGLL